MVDCEAVRILVRNHSMARWRERKILKKLGIVVGFSLVGVPRDAMGTYHLPCECTAEKRPSFLNGGAEVSGAERMPLRHMVAESWRGSENLHGKLVKYPFKPNSLDGADAEELKVAVITSNVQAGILGSWGAISEFRKQRKEDDCGSSIQAEVACAKWGASLPGTTVVSPEPIEELEQRFSISARVRW